MRRAVREETPSRLAIASSVCPSANNRTAAACCAVRPSGPRTATSASGCAAAHVDSKSAHRATSMPCPVRTTAPAEESSLTGISAVLRSTMSIRVGSDATVRT